MLTFNMPEIDKNCRVDRTKLLVLHGNKTCYMFLNSFQEKNYKILNIDEPYDIPQDWDQVLMIDSDWNQILSKEEHRDLVSAIENKFHQNGLSPLEVSQ